MRIMLDTNVLISALVFGGRTGRLPNMLFESEHELYVSEYIDQEFIITIYIYIFTEPFFLHSDSS